jgi:hypothetical protein
LADAGRQGKNRERPLKIGTLVKKQGKMVENRKKTVHRLPLAVERRCR